MNPMKKRSRIIYAIFIAYTMVITLYAMVVSYGFFQNLLYFAQTYSLIRIFEDMENRAIDNPQKAMDYADYVENHCPVGTFFATFSPFLRGSTQHEWIVEKCRNETLDRMKVRMNQSVPPSSLKHDTTEVENR